MARLPDWLAERMRIRPTIWTPEPEPRMQPNAPQPPEDAPPDHVRVPCPDPECGYIEIVHVQRAESPWFTLSGHLRQGAHGDDHRCWLGGLEYRAAESVLRMREENGGRLQRAAHP